MKTSNRGLLHHNRVVSDDPVRRIYWKMRDVAAELRVDSFCIKYWLKQFEMEPRKTNNRGDRVFNQKEFNQLKLIKEMLRDRGLRIWKAKELFKKETESKNAIFDQNEEIELLNTMSDG